MSDKRLLFLKLCFWLGALADQLACSPLFGPEAVKVKFGLPAVVTAGESLYASRVGGSLMLGWSRAHGNRWKAERNLVWK